VKALRSHGPTLDPGFANLAQHIANVRAFGLPAVVAVNRFPDDTDADIALVQREAERAGAVSAFPSEVFARGGEGGRELAEGVVAAAEKRPHVTPVYDPADRAITKMEKLATRLYGADGIDLLPAAERRLERFEALGYGNLPVCMAKTPLSLSHDPALKGAPKGFRVPIRELRLSAGAGFLYALTGEVMTMPGLPSVPAAANIDIDEDGNTIGLY
jgi:formyltetrahydrofolate synthetase